jgi:hypothetical protein
MITDVMLLLGTAVLSVLHQWNVLYIQMHGDLQTSKLHLYGGTTKVILRAATSLASLYVDILLLGFLCFCLLLGAAPVAKRTLEFHAFMILLLLFWLLEFLKVVHHRNIFTAAFRDATVASRTFAAGAQIFVTHGSVMLGAVLMGHSAHFQKCPDMTWRVFLVKVVPTGIILGFFVGGTMFWREHCAWDLVRDEFLCYSLFPAIELTFDVCGGFLMWRLAGRNLDIWEAEAEAEAGDATAEDEAETEAKQHGKRPTLLERAMGWTHESKLGTPNISFAEIVDYDGVLLGLTFSIAIFYNVSMSFEKYAEYGFLLAGMEFIRLIAPFGAASFAYSVWKHPPKPGSHLCRHGLWFGIAFVCCQFMSFQIIEDCHTSSDLPSCCRYPGFGTYHLDATCDKSSRCLDSGTMHIADGIPELKLFCAHGHDPHRRLSESSGSWYGSYNHFGHMGVIHIDPVNASLGDRFAQRFQQYFDGCCCCQEHMRHVCGFNVMPNGSKPCPVDSHGEEEITTQCLHELTCRWNVFHSLGAYAKEAAEHQDKISASFYLFEVIGLAITIEMYFTIFGIILKVIFLTEHPNSEEILRLDVHHQMKDHITQENVVVTASFAPSHMGVPTHSFVGVYASSFRDMAARHRRSHDLQAETEMRGHSDPFMTYSAKPSVEILQTVTSGKTFS